MKINIGNIAKLANLPLKDSEKNKLEPQLEKTLEYINHLNEIDTNQIEPTSQVTGLENITREDIASESLTQEEALSNTKNHHNGLFKVKAIFGDD